MRLVMAIALALLTICKVSHATTLVKLSFDDLVQAADGVLAGTVADIVSRKAQDGMIYTFVTLDALEIIRGSYDGERFTLRLEGGEVEGEVLEVEGAPSFREGERVVVFVEGNGERIVPIAGWEQGLFRVIRDPATGREYISDAVGNRVFGIREGEVIKESRVGSEAELFGQRGFAAQSEAPAIDFGQTNGGREVLPEEELRGQAPVIETQVVIGDVLTYSAFKEQIDVQMDAAGVGELGTLVSVEPGRLPAPQLEDGAPARTPTVEEPLELAPSERGEAPRRIEEGTRIDLDQE